MYLQPSIFSKITTHDTTPAVQVVSGMSDISTEIYAMSYFRNRTQWYEERLRVQNTFFSDNNMSVQTPVILNQVHENTIYDISVSDIKSDTPCIVEADGVATTHVGIVGLVTVADCAGIVIYDAGNQSIGVLHSGWRGTAGVDAHNSQGKSIVQSYIEQYLLSTHASMDSVYVWISPCAKPCCYEVGKEITHFFQSFPQSVVKRDNQYKLDIAYYIRQQILEYGIPAPHIEVSPQCTICNTTFHSFRRYSELSNQGCSLHIHKRSMVFAYMKTIL